MKSFLDKNNMLSSNLCKVIRQGHLRNASSVFNNSINKSMIGRSAWTAVELGRDPKELRSKYPEPSFNVAKLTEVLDHDNHEMRKEMREFLSDPIMRTKFNISLEEERDVSSSHNFCAFHFILNRLPSLIAWI